MRACVDLPAAGQICDSSYSRMEGWAVSDLLDQPLTHVIAREGERIVGLTRRWFLRPDVNRALNLPGNAHTGFALMVEGLTPTAESTASITLDFYHHEARMGTLTLPIVVSRSPARELDSPLFPASGPTRAELLRDGSPPPSLGIDRTRQLVRLLERGLPPPARIVELHCGEGWLGRRLSEVGYTWHGLERQADACQRLLARGQPHTRIQTDTTPFESGAFDLAVIANFSLGLLDSTVLLAELQRIAPRALAVATSLAPTPKERFSPERMRVIKDQIEAAFRPFYSHVETVPFGEPIDSVAAPGGYTHLLTLAWKESA